MHLVCLPYAGGRAAVFRDWADALPSSVRTVPLDYPRGNADTIGVIAERLSGALRGWPDNGALALFGHSLGAPVAYETAIRLARIGQPPRILFVSGHRAPGVAPSEPPLHGLPWAGLQARLTHWGGVPRTLRENPAALAAFEPALREDLRLAETWAEPAHAPALPCPVIALAGHADVLAPPPSMSGWQRVTRAAFRQHILPGSHFFLHEQQQQLLAMVALEIERYGA